MTHAAGRQLHQNSASGPCSVQLEHGCACAHHGARSENWLRSQWSHRRDPSDTQPVLRLNCRFQISARRAHKASTPSRLLDSELERVARSGLCFCWEVQVDRPMNDVVMCTADGLSRAESRECLPLATLSRDQSGSKLLGVERKLAVLRLGVERSLDQPRRRQYRTSQVRSEPEPSPVLYLKGSAWEQVSLAMPHNKRRAWQVQPNLCRKAASEAEQVDLHGGVPSSKPLKCRASSQGVTLAGPELPKWTSLFR